MKSTDSRKDFPSVVDIAYEQYIRDLSRYKQVKDIMSTNVITISPEASMNQAADIMGENHIGSLIVSKYNTPVGIVTERDFLSKVLAYEKIPKDTRVEAVMSYPLITIGSTAKIKEAARLMMSKKSRLAVFDSGRIVGVVTASDLIRSLPEVQETEVKVDDFMTKEIVTADEKTPVNGIIKLMSKNRIGSVIVTTQGEPFGIFTERDLLSTFLFKGKPLTAEVGKESSSPLITTVAGTSIHRAAALMALKHIRRLPVAAEDKLMGIITARDLVEVYSK
jgi:CBS domain-containing protein